MILILSACSSQGGERDASADSAIADGATEQAVDQAADQFVDQAMDQLVEEPDAANSAPVLDNAHQGWTYKWCDKCHVVPVVAHTETEPIGCIGCHGANGSCTPPDDHDQSRDCTSVGCHGVRHTYGKNADCLTCHYADKGVAPCSH